MNVRLIVALIVTATLLPVSACQFEATAVVHPPDLSLPDGVVLTEVPRSGALLGWTTSPSGLSDANLTEKQLERLLFVIAWRDAPRSVRR